MRAARVMLEALGFRLQSHQGQTVYYALTRTDVRAQVDVSEVVVYRTVGFEFEDLGRWPTSEVTLEALGAVVGPWCDAPDTPRV